CTSTPPTTSSTRPSSASPRNSQSRCLTPSSSSSPSPTRPTATAPTPPPPSGSNTSSSSSPNPNPNSRLAIMRRFALTTAAAGLLSSVLPLAAQTNSPLQTLDDHFVGIWVGTNHDYTVSPAITSSVTITVT